MSEHAVIIDFYLAALPQMEIKTNLLWNVAITHLTDIIKKSKNVVLYLGTKKRNLRHISYL
jgi:hypothetical protein